jgi:uncharacterized protein
MKFSEEKFEGNYVSSYKEGKLHIGEKQYKSPVLLTKEVINLNGLEDFSALNVEYFQSLAAYEPEFVLLGFPMVSFAVPEAWSYACHSQGWSFEAMHVAAACRTFAVLRSENRKVLALLFP